MRMPYRSQPLVRSQPLSRPGPGHQNSRGFQDGPSGIPAPLFPPPPQSSAGPPPTPFSFSKRPLQHSAQRALLHSRTQPHEPSDSVSSPPAATQSSGIAHPRRFAFSQIKKDFQQSSGQGDNNTQPAEATENSPSMMTSPSMPVSACPQPNQASGNISSRMTSPRTPVSAWSHLMQQQPRAEPRDDGKHSVAGPEGTSPPPATPSLSQGPPSQQLNEDATSSPRASFSFTNRPCQQQQTQWPPQQDKSTPTSAVDGSWLTGRPAAGLAKKRVLDGAGAQPHVPVTASIRSRDDDRAVSRSSFSRRQHDIDLRTRSPTEPVLPAPQLLMHGADASQQPCGVQPKPMKVPAQSSLQGRLGAGDHPTHLRSRVSLSR